MTEIIQIEQAIATLESQRAILGDRVVNTVLASLREKLTALQVKAVSEQRKQVTVLFASVSGLTDLLEVVDAEEINDLLLALWQRFDQIIVGHGGRIDKHMGEVVMALWGVEATHEDDAEQATRAAMAMQREIVDFKLPISNDEIQSEIQNRNSHRHRAPRRDGCCRRIYRHGRYRQYR